MSIKLEIKVTNTDTDNSMTAETTFSQLVSINNIIDDPIRVLISTLLTELNYKDIALIASNELKLKLHLNSDWGLSNNIWTNRSDNYSIVETNNNEFYLYKGTEKQMIQICKLQNYSHLMEIFTVLNEYNNI